MKFCPKCKALLIPKKKKLECSCGYTKKNKEEVILKKEEIEQNIIEIIDEDKEIEDAPEIPIVCWNCGHRGVMYWMQQMRRSDEPPTRFYRCKKCRKTWRSGK